MAQTYPSEEEINHEQTKQLLRYIAFSQSASVVESIFCQLGRDCFHIRKLDAWLEGYRGNVASFLDWVNVQQASRYWERLEFTSDGQTLALTGRKVQKCACRFADGEAATLALCHFCCRAFQEEIFGTLLGQKVEVEITESFLLGDERCSTVIRLQGEQEINAGG
jgi:hypothetical protein